MKKPLISIRILLHSSFSVLSLLSLEDRPMIHDLCLLDRYADHNEAFKSWSATSTCLFLRALKVSTLRYFDFRTAGQIHSLQSTIEYYDLDRMIEFDESLRWQSLASD